MSTDAVAIIGFVALFVLMLLRVPVGMAMGLVGVSGFAYLNGGAPALKLVGQTSMRTVTDYTFGVIPMFLLMGAFVTNSGMSRELFRAANSFVGHLRGGLGIATVAACGGFALLGFPLDDMWHRLFGQDVTLWGPTHLMLFGGAGQDRKLIVRLGGFIEQHRLGFFSGADDLIELMPKLVRGPDVSFTSWTQRPERTADTDAITDPQVANPVRRHLSP